MIQQAAQHGANARGAAENDLHRIAQHTQHGHHIAEHLLAACCLLLFLCGVIIVQGAQLAQIILIRAVVLRIGVVVCFALLLQLGVVVRELVVVLLLGILVRCCSADPAGSPARCHRWYTYPVPDCTAWGWRCSAHRSAADTPAGRRSWHSWSHNRRSGLSLRRSICAGVVGVLQIVLLVLAVERILGVAVLEALTLQQLVQKLVDPLLIAALIIARRFACHSFSASAASITVWLGL